MEEHSGADTVRFGGFRFDRRRGVLSRQNEDGQIVPVPIGSRALDILGLLIDRHGDLVSKDEMLVAVWPRIVVEGANVTVQISALRRVLDEGRAEPSLIQTIPGRGYRFTAAVTLSERIDADRAIAPSASARQDWGAPQSSVSSSHPERRPITVLSCGTTGLARVEDDPDPEEALKTIAALHAACVEVIGSYGGFVANCRGGNLLAYFGYPQAHEDDAERAIRAGLTLLDAIGRLETPDRWQTKIGIASGVVVIGDLIGQGEAQERAIIGEAPNLAVSMQVLAEPNAIVIADNTRDHIGALFAIEDLASTQLQGSPPPQRAWRIVGESRGMGRFEALRSANAPLVGREEEIALLMRRWTQAKAGEGHAVLLSGEPGVGKSRLSAALEDRLLAEPHFPLRYFCSPHHQDSALYPIIGQLERAAGFERDDDPETRFEKLETLIAAASPEREDAALLADLLSLPGAERYPPLEATPQRRREKTFNALLRQLTGLARRQPVLIVFEDLQWIDPTSRELLDLIVQCVETWPALLIATFRPEFQPPWTGLPQVTAMSLNRLGRRDAAALVQGLSGEKAALPSHVVDEIVGRADGVPLFLEELTKAVLENTGDPVGTVVSTVSETAPAVPATLQASLMARLDRLGPTAKELAQVGAAIGREFTFELLAAAAARAEVELAEAMAMLVEAGLVFQRGTPPQASFLFKHALVQDVAYGALLHGQLQQLHGRIADAILSASSDGPAAAPEIIAHHLQRAGRSVEAITYWREAGEQAVRRAANREAIAHFRRALSLIETQPEAPERWRAELAVLVQLGPALINITTRSSPEAGEAADRAVQLASRLESWADLALSLSSLWNFHLHRGQFRRADEISSDLYRIARKLNDPEILLQAHHAAWATDWPRCRLMEGREHIVASLALYDEESHARHRYVYIAHDPAACALSVDAVFHMLLGHPSEATRCGVEAITLARRLRHPPSLAQALGQVCESQVMRKDLSAVTATATELIKLSEEYGIIRQRYTALIFLGWAMAQSGEPTESIALLQEAWHFRSQLGARLGEPRTLGFIAESLLVAGCYADGLEYVARALQVAAEIGEQWYVSRLYQLRGELLLHAHGSNGGAAEASFREAIAVARQQGARGWELRVATSLAHLLLDRGRRIDARELLAPVYGWFTEGFDTPDLQKAKALLDALG
jgi:DNA-binding winged helix-turn-helix (wHTH) protein/predicted ATPase